MLRPHIRFTVYGTPQAKGSAKAFLPPGTEFPVVTSTNRNVAKWEQTIRTECQRVMTSYDGDVLTAMFTAPLSVTLIFHVDRPKSTPKRITLPATQPDLDKMVRSAIDAMQKVLFKNDGQVVAIGARKVFADGPSRIDILVESWADFHLPKPAARAAVPQTESLPL